MKLAWEEEYKRHGMLWRGIPDVGDIERLVQQGVNSSFDAVVCRFVLEHLYERERVQAIAEMYRVLRRGGTLFLAAFSTNDMRYSQSLKNPPVEQNTFKRASGIICHYFTEPELRNLLRRFQILDFKVNRQKAAKGEAFDRNEEQ